MQRRTKSSPDQLPLIVPDSSWTPPTSLPDLRGESEVAIDIETRDDLLAKDRGPGFYAYERTNFNTGFVCGLSVAWRDHSIYIPVRHYETDCMDPDLVRRWLEATAAQTHTTFVFHNFQYDWGWLEAVFGVKPPVSVDDVAAMASMINENLTSFKLDSLCKWQGIPGKDETLLTEAGVVYSSTGKAGLWRLPARYVGPYAEQDAVSTLNLAKKLRPLLAEENLDTAYQVERDLLPVTLKMKQRGIRIDLERTKKLAKDIFDRCNEDLYRLSETVGEKITIKCLRSNGWLKEKFDKYNIEYKYTAASETYKDGQASFEKSYMANHEHPFPRAVHAIKHRYDLADKFLVKFILKYEYKGRVYPTVNQFRSEDGGARSHRFSYADPPLQQMPSRDDEYAPLIRASFLPEEGEVWCSIDYRQQEYRLIVFVAELCRKKGALEAANRYRKDPSTDFHNYVAEITRLQRRRAKDVNFAKSYGAGVPKFALMTGMDEEEARKVMEQYDNELPFVKEIYSHYSRYAAKHGHIRMIDGARNHFNLFEPIFRDFNLERECKRKDPMINTLPCDEEEFKRRHDNPNHPWHGERPKRAFTHKAFNRMIQGSAARQIKKAMVEINRAGYPILLQIHDELGFSLRVREDAYKCAKIMEEAMPMISIPMLTDVKIGRSWGELQK